MIVGVAHLVAKADLHNSTWGQDALGPAMQAQIKLVVARLAAFRPTKVMIEADPGKPVYVERYKAYLAGRYSLGPNEDDQFGYRLAAMAKNPTIYPIDTHANFPFHYDAVQASARRNSQTAILAAADAHIASLVATSSALEKQNRLLDVLRYINTPASLDVNASWYTYVDRIGNAGSDYAGANLVSYWYARNLHIFANIMHVVIPGDRVVIFIGQGHAAILRPLVILSPDLRFVSPLSYLR
ncbi:MAG TPA: DUF5694 domain-containing protein [Candidatus Baltobacteraceae bacterium]|nr:DUF5694 domain-containing protein [Candidatus Baltobacteraceae bacterium]